jgi:hypothetical protein
LYLIPNYQTNYSPERNLWENLISCQFENKCNCRSHEKKLKSTLSFLSSLRSFNVSEN